MQRDAAHGYVLEELLAWLIRNAGYRLLVDPVQDPRELARRGAGLVVRGRGGVHQADVLGELAWIPAFTFPIRLFVEAKFRGSKIGLPEVRAAVGIIDDLNQNFSPIFPGSQPATQRYAYRYALFSASGFTGTAVDMATAHQISLIDLRAPGFHDLLDIVRAAVAALFGGTRARNARVSHANVRTRVRQVLGTWPIEVPRELTDELEVAVVADVFEPEDAPELREPDNRGYVPGPADVAEFEYRLSEGATSLGEFFLGVPNGPFLLLLRASNPTAFLTFARANPSHDVHITWDLEVENGEEWSIYPVDEPEAYHLRFALPQRLAEWIFERAEQATAQAAHAKRRYLSRISVYRHEDGRDEIFSLTYQPGATAAQRRARRGHRQARQIPPG